MNMIVAADDNWAIGYKNHLLVSIPSDMKFFRQTTTGKVVVMGRKTLESFPEGRPLKNRTNIVLSRLRSSIDGALVLHSLDELLQQLRQYDTDDIYVIGGDSIYRQLLPYTDTVHVTKIHKKYAADAWFPNLDEMEEWKITGDSDEQTYFDLEYEFLRYERKKK